MIDERKRTIVRQMIGVQIDNIARDEDFYSEAAEAVLKETGWERASFVRVDEYVTMHQGKLAYEYEWVFIEAPAIP